MFKINKDFLAGAVVGFGAGLMARGAQGDGSGGTVLRDSAKKAMKLGLVSLDTLKRQAARLKETMEDIAAEAQAEAKTETVHAEIVNEEAPSPKVASSKTKG